MRLVLRRVLWMNRGLVALKVGAWISSGARSAVDSAAEAHPDVHSAYGIRGRPGEIFAELTIALDPAMDVLSSHRVADEVEARVGQAPVEREVVVHVEPAA